MFCSFGLQSIACSALSDGSLKTYRQLIVLNQQAQHWFGTMLTMSRRYEAFVNNELKLLRSSSQSLEEFKKDKERKGDPTEWSHPMNHLDIKRKEAFLLGKAPLDFLPQAPRSLFAKSSKNGLWLYSPYLCGTGMVEMLNMSSDWGTKCWGRSGYMQSFFHLYNMLLQNKHIKNPLISSNS